MTLALFFQIIGTVLFIKALKSKKRLLLIIISFFFYSLSLISYQTAKLTTPLLMIFLLVIYRKVIFKQARDLVYLLILFCIYVIYPIGAYFYFRPISEMRFAGISVFTVWKSTLPQGESFLSSLNLQTIFSLPLILANNYLKHFNPSLLFLDNSHLRYYQLENVGLFYLWEGVFILLGLIILVRHIKVKKFLFLLLWLLISPLAAALTMGVPNANVGRALMLLPVVEILCVLGLLGSLRFTKLRLLQIQKFLIGFLIITIVLNNIYFNRQYYLNSPGHFADQWGLPLKKAVRFIVPLEDDVDKIIITTRPNIQAYMYMLFYGHKDPQWLLDNRGDRAEVVGYKEIGKYEFRLIDWEKDKLLPNALLIGTPEEIPQGAEGVIEEILSPRGEVSLRIVRTPIKTSR